MSGTDYAELMVTIILLDFREAFSLKEDTYLYLLIHANSDSEPFQDTGKGTF